MGMMHVYLTEPICSKSQTVIWGLGFREEGGGGKNDDSVPHVSGQTWCVPYVVIVINYGLAFKKWKLDLERGHF